MGDEEDGDCVCELWGAFRVSDMSRRCDYGVTIEDEILMLE
jgi:hypothetical protein